VTRTGSQEWAAPAPAASSAKTAPMAARTALAAAVARPRKIDAATATKRATGLMIVARRSGMRRRTSSSTSMKKNRRS
jgi:hypothetical protein